MPVPNRLAHLQQGITFALVGAAGSWWLYFRSHAPQLAIAGIFTIVLCHAGVLALEVMLLRIVNKNDPTPKATTAELFRAWWGESLATPPIFCWRQPFRANAVPDLLGPAHTVYGRRGVVFIHGFFCNRGFWTPWLKRLRGTGNAFVAVSLEPVFASIDDYAPQIEAAVVQVTRATGMAPLLVCHSMGGLAARAWLKAMQSEERVHHVVTIGTPHRGTWLARFGHGKNGQQMRLLSDWHAGLDHAMPASRHALFTCWYSNTDNVVFPASTATLPGADNQLVRGAAHVQMAFLPHIIANTLARLNAAAD